MYACWMVASPLKGAALVAAGSRPRTCTQDRQLAAVDVHSFHLYLAWYPTTRLADEEDWANSSDVQHPGGLINEREKGQHFRVLHQPTVWFASQLHHTGFRLYKSRDVLEVITLLLEEVRGIPGVWEQVRQWSVHVADKPMLVTDRRLSAELRCTVHVEGWQVHLFGTKTRWKWWAFTNSCVAICWTLFGFVNSFHGFLCEEAGAGGLYGFRGAVEQKWTEEYQALLLKTHLEAVTQNPGIARPGPGLIWEDESGLRLHNLAA